MGNLRRYFEENGAYFVTTVTKRREALFNDPKLCRVLLITIEYYKMIFDYKVYGYCLMPDHLHLILVPSRRFNLSFILKMIKGTFTRKVNKLDAKDGSLWQRRFYEEVIRDERQLLHQLDYIHMNPVVGGIVPTAKDFPYSSFSQYHGFSNPVGEILQIDNPSQS